MEQPTVRGVPVSGRKWKTLQTAKSATMKPKSLRQGWEKHQAERKQKEIVKLMQNEMKEEIKAAKEEKKRHLEERRKRKEENERKAEIVQAVSAAKVKRMKKKALRQIRRTGEKKEIGGKKVAKNAPRKGKK
ncbi:hypothetical protein HK101_006632 [Irineochytrium annulatum]|nr:hypothetical protein HK101_006632 [Irineochytrium annulatum]